MKQILSVLTKLFYDKRKSNPTFSHADKITVIKRREMKNRDEGNKLKLILFLKVYNLANI